MNWSTAWLAALAEPEAPMPFIPPPRTFSNQTVRQRIRLRTGGTAIRLIFSNQFGDRPLVLDEIGANGHPVLLAGRMRWEIPVGEFATSDPIPLPIGAGDELVVNAYAAIETGPATYLHSAQRTVEIAAGNQVHANKLAEPERCASLFWLSQAQINAPVDGPVIVALGDSITRGDATSVDRDQRYPDHLQRRLEGIGAVVLNAGIGANRLLRRQVGPSMTDRFDRDVLGVTGASHVVIMAGVNDIALPFVFGEQQPTAAQLIDGLFALARRARRAGIQPIVGTVTPFGSSTFESVTSPGNEQIRQAVNTAITTQQELPVADFAAAVADPHDPGRLAPEFDSGDGLHPSDDGARALATAVADSAFA